MPARYAERKAKYYQDNKERLDEYKRAWNEKNKDRINARRRAAYRAARLTPWTAMLEQMG